MNNMIIGIKKNLRLFECLKKYIYKINMYKINNKNALRSPDRTITIEDSKNTK